MKNILNEKSNIERLRETIHEFRTYTAEGIVSIRGEVKTGDEQDVRNGGVQSSWKVVGLDLKIEERFENKEEILKFVHSWT